MFSGRFFAKVFFTGSYFEPVVGGIIPPVDDGTGRLYGIEPFSRMGCR
jgi:hypothetical protein